MYLYQFEKNDVLRNVINAYPHSSFFIYNKNIYYNNEPAFSGTFSDPVKNVPSGYVSLFELNIDRRSSDFITSSVQLGQKGGFRTAFKTTLSSSLVGKKSDYIDSLVYPLSASISKFYYGSSVTGSNRKFIHALKNTMAYHTTLSPHYIYSSSYQLLNRDFDQVDVGLINVPAIFYGSGLKKGSVSLKYYVSGTLIGELFDKYRDGRLIQYSGAFSEHDGRVGGVVLYNEGLILLTGSWGISQHTEEYIASAGDETPKWKYHSQTLSGSSVSSPSSSYSLDFKGIHKVPTMTLFAHVGKGKLNNSNNYSFIDHTTVTSSNFPVTGSFVFRESYEREVKNIVSASHNSASFERVTYISKVGIYDKNRNLIGVAKLAKPVKKTEELDLTFKLNMDL